MWVATREAEHAVSTLTAGPRRAKVKHSRPLATLGEAAVKLKLLMATPWCALRLS